MMKYYCFNLNFTPNTPINQHISLGLVFCLIPYYKPNIKYNNDIISEEDSCLYIPYPPNKSNFIEYDKKYFISNRASIASTTYGKLIIRLINIRANPTTNQLAMLVEYEKEEYHNLSLDDIYNVYSMSSYSYEDAILEMLNRSFDNKYLNLFGIKRQYLE